MSVRRVAVFSMHTSPLAQPGSGDGGGMNVYVRALAPALPLARVKADAGIDDDPEHRSLVEHEVVACADLMLASTAAERAQLAGLYDAAPQRIEVVPPGVDHLVFSPGDRDAARHRLGVDASRMLLFAGRIQPLKGADLAVRCLAA